jgi:hypothetical protein
MMIVLKFAVINRKQMFAFVMRRAILEKQDFLTTSGANGHKLSHKRALRRNE